VSSSTLICILQCYNIVAIEQDFITVFTSCFFKSYLMKPDHVRVTGTVAGAVNLIGVFPSGID
jgi:hypothetical protein